MHTNTFLVLQDAVVGSFLQFLRRVFKHARFINILAELNIIKIKEGEEEDVSFQTYDKFTDERFEVLLPFRF